MKTSLSKSKLILVLIIFGECFAFLCLGQILAQTEEQQPIPELKSDLPKLDIPKQPLPPVQRNPLKGSVQHSEVVKPNNLNGNSNLGRLDGSSSKGLFKLKSNQMQGGLNQTTTTGLGIIGMKFAIYFGKAPVIYQVFPGTPAIEAGLKPGDLIVAVDGIPTFGLAKNEVYNLIVGQPGTQVTISFKHNRSVQVHTMTRMDVNAIPDPRVRRDYLSM